MNVRLEIIMNELGQVNVTGPIENKLLCYGLLAVAHEVVQQHCEAAARRVQHATPATLATLTRDGKDEI